MMEPPWPPVFSSYRLSMQRALWGSITPSMRGIALGWEDGTARARFVFDREPTEDEVELVEVAETEVISDMPEDVRTSFVIEVAPGGGLDYRDGEVWWAYLRHEAP